MHVAIITISDSVTQGTRTSDVSGDAIAQWCQTRGDEITVRETVPDDTVAIVRTLLRVCDIDRADLILTTGGTGLSPRDVTPEATRAVLDREAVGIAELLRTSVTPTFPRAALSRGIAGVRGRTLIVNLPGSPNGVRDSLATLDPIVDHACHVLTGTIRSHDG